MIIQYIIEILKTEDNIFINDLGLFEKKLLSAEMKDNILSPPQFKIFFNPNGNGNGFAFILKYAERKQKRLTEADAEIKQWVNDLKNGIRNNQSVHIEGFGSFSLNSKGEITFDSDHIQELNIEFEGLEPVQTSPITPVPEKPTEDGETDSATEEPTVEKTTTAAVSKEDAQENEEKNDTIPVPEKQSIEEESEKNGVETLKTVMEENLREKDEEVEETIVEKQPNIPSQEETVPDTEEKHTPIGTPAIERTETQDTTNGEQTEEIQSVEKTASTTPPKEMSEEEKINVPDTNAAEQEIPSDEELKTTENRGEEIPKKKKKRKTGWIILGIILLLLIPATYFGYQHRVELELVYKEYAHKLFKKSSQITQHTTKDLTLHLPEREFPGHSVITELNPPYLPGISPEEIIREKPVIEESLSITETEPVKESSPSEPSSKVKSVKKTENTVAVSTSFPHEYFQKGKYYVIAGSFINEQDASKHIIQHQFQKYNPVLLHQEGNTRIRVCIGIFDNSREAEALAASMKKGAWVLQ